MRSSGTIPTGSHDVDTSRTVAVMFGRGPALLGATSLLLAACAAPAPVLRPADFPRHTVDKGYDLHWRLERGGGEARAVGLVQPGINTFVELTLRLQGLDENGRLVSQGFEVVLPRRFASEPTPFTVSLRLTGREDRFEVGVWRDAPHGMRSRR